MNSILRALICWPAWLVSLVTFGATGLVSWPSRDEMVLSAAVSVMVFITCSVGRATRRHNTQLVRESAEDRYRAEQAWSILDGIPGMAWQCDANGARTYVSPVWLAATGQAIEESMGQGWLHHVHPDDRERAVGANRLAAVSQTPYETEYRLREAGGDWRWVRDRAKPYYDADATFCGYTGLIEIQAPAAADEDPIQRALRLYETINEQAIELADRFEDLEEEKRQIQYSDRLKCDFLGALSDDLRGPVQELHNAAELLIGADLTEEQRSCADRIRSVSDSLRGMLDRTERFSTLAEDPEIVEMGQFNLRQLIEQVAKHEHAAARQRGVVTSVIVDDAVPVKVKADPLRLRRMLLDLWAATLRLAKGGRVMFRVARADPEAAATARPDIRFSITYSGEGFTDELLERALYPVESIGGEKPGLGLGPCRRLATLMGGQFGVQRDDDDEVTFWFRLGMIDLQPTWDGRRAHDRIVQESLMSSLGPVLDLSLGGMRVRTQRPPEGTIEIELSDDEEAIVLQAEVAWTRRIGFGKHEVGLKFDSLEPEHLSQLGRLATRNRLRRVLRAA